MPAGVPILPPMRQSTGVNHETRKQKISKLPIRQSTSVIRCIAPILFSKLPMRQTKEFLSCLCGSQLTGDSEPPRYSFLSCLCGSQRSKTICREVTLFLSCLCGSQLQKKVKELRRHRGKTHLHLFYPKFQQGARKADRIGFSCIGQKFWSKFRDRGTIAQAIGAQCSRLLYLTGCLLDEEGKGLCGR